MTSLIDQLKECWQNYKSAKQILGQYGVQHKKILKNHWDS